MNPKKNPNHKEYIRILRNMTPEQRLLKAFDLSEFTKQLFIHGLRKRFPDLPEEEFHKLLLERIEKCHNRNYTKRKSRCNTCYMKGDANYVNIQSYV